MAVIEIVFVGVVFAVGIDEPIFAKESTLQRMIEQGHGDCLLPGVVKAVGVGMDHIRAAHQVRRPAHTLNAAEVVPQLRFTLRSDEGGTGAEVAFVYI